MRSQVQLFAAIVTWSVAGSGSAFADPALMVNSTAGRAGDLVEMTVDYQGEGNVVALDFELKYDPKRLTAGPVISAAIPPHTASASVLSPGILKVLVPVVVENPLPIVETASPLISVPFVVSAQADPGVVPVTLTNVVLADVNGEPVRAKILSGGIAIQP
jgi:hypothetical protein